MNLGPPLIHFGSLRSEAIVALEGCFRLQTEPQLSGFGGDTWTVASRLWLHRRLRRARPTFRGRDAASVTRIGHLMRLVSISGNCRQSSPVLCRHNFRCCCSAGCAMTMPQRHWSFSAEFRCPTRYACVPTNEPLLFRVPVQSRSAQHSTCWLWNWFVGDTTSICQLL